MKKKEYKISLKELLEAGCHFGHQAKRWNPKMQEYIYIKKEGIHVFDLVKTADNLGKAMEYVRDIISQRKKIMFVGTKRQASEIIRESGKKHGVCYSWLRWLGGTITNWEQIKKSVDKLKDLEEKKKKGEFKKYTKKENVLIDRDILRLDRFFGGMRDLGGIPEALFVVDVKREIAAVKEAKDKGVTVVAIVDSNVDPDYVDYVIPANDDAINSIKFIVSKICEAVEDGKAMQGKIKPKKESIKVKKDKPKKKKVVKKAKTKFKKKKSK